MAVVSAASNAGRSRAMLLAGCLLLAACAALQQAPPAGSKPQVRVAQVDGRVLVVRGGTYVVAHPGMVLQPDDQVVTMDGAKARLSYRLIDPHGKSLPGGCQLKLPGASQVTIHDSKDCGDSSDIMHYGQGTVTVKVPPAGVRSAGVPAAGDSTTGLHPAPQTWTPAGEPVHGLQFSPSQ